MAPRWKSGAASLALVVLSAALYSALFPPLSLRLLAWIALVPFLAVSARLTPGWAALGGFVFGITVGFGVYWWFPGMLTGFFRVDPVPAWIFSVLGAGPLLAVPYVLFAAWLSALARRGPVSPLVVALGWMALEKLIVMGPLPNPLGLLGHALVTTPLAQTADLVGQYGVGVPVVAVNSLLAGVVTPRLRGRSTARSAVLVVLLLVSVFGYGSWRLAQGESRGASARIAIVQGAIEHDFFVAPEEREDSAERYLELTRGLVGEKLDLVVWPEWAANRYLAEPGGEQHSLLSDASSFDFDLILGAPHRERSQSGFADYNSVFLVRAGRAVARYDKVELVPFAEYDPLSGLRSWRRRRYSPGGHSRPLPSRAGRVGVMICSEATEPKVARHLVADGAEVLANPSNDYWFGHPAPAMLQLQAAAMRTIETRRFMVRAAATGYSVVIDARGRLRELGPWGGEATLRATVQRLRVMTLYQRWGDAPAYLAIGLSLLAPFGRRGGRRSGLARP